MGWPFKRAPSPGTQLDLYERALKDIAGDVPKGVLPASAVIGAKALALSVLRQARGLAPI